MATVIASTTSPRPSTLAHALMTARVMERALVGAAAAQTTLRGRTAPAVSESNSNSLLHSHLRSALVRIHSKDLMEGTIGQNKWSYYKFTAPDSQTSITVELIEVETEGYLSLFVLQGAPPELTGSQYSDGETSRLHNIYFRYNGNDNSDHDFYIGVYGTALVPLGSPVPYKVFGKPFPQCLSLLTLLCSLQSPNLSPVDQINHSNMLKEASLVGCPRWSNSENLK
jgi:hypothetical protein